VEAEGEAAEAEAHTWEVAVVEGAVDRMRWAQQDPMRWVEMDHMAWGMDRTCVAVILRKVT
jgi:hypothetical protein